MDKISQVEGLHLLVWYFDDGTFIGTHSAIAKLLHRLQLLGPDFGIHLNLAKCDVFWPSGDQTFKGFFICRVVQSDGGAALLGSPVHGSGDFYESVVSNKVEKVLTMQLRLKILMIHRWNSCYFKVV